MVQVNYKGFIIVAFLMTFLSCQKEDSPTPSQTYSEQQNVNSNNSGNNGGSGSNNNNWGRVAVFTQTQWEAGHLHVTLTGGNWPNGYTHSIHGNRTPPPDCTTGNNMAEFCCLDPGVYSYSVTCLSQKTWTGTVTVTANGCTILELL